MCMKIRQTLLLLLLLLLLGGCAAPAGTSPDEGYDELIVVGFSQVGAESDWRNANTRSMQQALSAENGFRLIIDDAQQKKERQITAIRNITVFIIPLLVAVIGIVVFIRRKNK